MSPFFYGPTGNLDRGTAEAVSKLMLALHREERSVLVVVAHSGALAAKFERQYELTDGTLLAQDA